MGEDDQDNVVVMPTRIDLELEKLVNNTTPVENDIVNFAITLTNRGPDTATNIDVVDIVPGGFSYVDGSISGGDSRSDGSPTGTGLLWEIDSLAPGADQALTFQAMVVSNQSPPQYTNSAQVTAAD